MTEYLIVHTHQEGISLCLVGCDFDLINALRDENAVMKFAKMLEIDYEPDKEEKIQAYTLMMLGSFEVTKEDFLSQE